MIHAKTGDMTSAFGVKSKIGPYPGNAILLATNKLVSDIIIKIISLEGPIAGDRIFKTAADCPANAEPGTLGSQQRRNCVVDAGARVDADDARSHEEQRPVNGEAQTAARRSVDAALCFASSVCRECAGA